MTIPDIPIPTQNMAIYSLPYIDARPIDELYIKQLTIPIKKQIMKSI